MKSVVLFIDSINQGGAQRQIIYLAKLLDKYGYKVTLLVYHDIRFYYSELADTAVKYDYVDAKNLFKRIVLLKRKIVELCPDVIISFLDAPNIIACLIKLWHNRFKLIVSERNTNQKLSVIVRLRFFLYRWTDYIVPNSYTQTAFIETNFPQYKDRLEIITNMIDINRFVPLGRKNDNGSTNIIGVGRVEYQKNVKCLIDAVYLLKSEGYSVTVDWYGRYDSRFDEVLEDYKVTQEFKFHQPTTNIVEKYQQADVFCLPSFYEGYPNVLCEAMCCGLPVICSDVCDNYRIMKDGINGYLFNPYSSRDLADTIARYIKLNQKEKVKLGDASRKLAENQFSERQYLESFLRLIEK